MSAHDDGGPAFPTYESNGNGHLYCSGAGMTLRDYFAVHATQPGMSEIASMAGLRYENGGVWKDEVTRISSFDTWFADMPLDQRLMLAARVRYAEADAMLKARAE